MSMIINYIKSSFRHIKNHKVNYLFKFAGLVTALFSFLVILIYIIFQLSFDTYHPDFGRIYRLNSIRNEDGKLENFATVPSALGPALKTQLPEIEEYVRLSEPSQALLKYDDKLLRVRGLIETDSTLFKMFKFDIIVGDERALLNKNNIVITESLAKQLFGQADPYLKIISFPERNNVALQVAAIIADPPANTHLNANAIINFGALNTPQEYVPSWEISWDGSVTLYLKLNEGSDPDGMISKLQPILSKNIPPTENGAEKDFRVYPQPLSKIYLDPPLKMEFTRKGKALHLYFFAVLGILLILIATINYYSLSIADFDTRNKEIGVRKVLGAEKTDVILQVMFETAIVFVASFIIAFLALYIFFPEVLSLLEPGLRLGLLLDPTVVTIVLVTLITLILVAAAYPAKQLTSRGTSFYLRKGQIGAKKFALGNTLLAFQFTISIVCICSTLIMASQIQYIYTKDVGFDKKNIITLVMPEQYPAEKVPVLKNELERLAGVEAAAYTYYFITGVPYFSDWYRVEVDNKMKRSQLNEIFVDHDFFSTMNVKLVAGRNFDKSNPSDSKTAFILNETAVNELGLVDPVGKRIGYGFDPSAESEGTIIGVVKDFNTRPLYDKVEPLVIRLPYDAWPGNCLNLKVSKPLTEMIPKIKEAYERVLPNYLIDYRLVEEMYEKQYEEENKAFTSLKIGTWITVLISSFGIFSMSLYMSIRRTKEFGIRKVLGASTGQIGFLQLSQFFRIAIFANLIAIPLSFIITRQWLNTFAYHISPGPTIFIAVASASFLLVLISAGYSSWSAARRNPIDTIKTE